MFVSEIYAKTNFGTPAKKLKHRFECRNVYKAVMLTKLTICIAFRSHVLQVTIINKEQSTWSTKRELTILKANLGCKSSCALKKKNSSLVTCHLHQSECHSLTRKTIRLSHPTNSVDFYSNCPFANKLENGRNVGSFARVRSYSTTEVQNPSPTTWASLTCTQKVSYRWGIQR